jgi:transposase InsO family protein
MPAELEEEVIKFTHVSLGHQGTEKCMAQIAQTFYIQSLGQKVRKLISRCDICQRVKHPNRSYATESRSHLPSEAGVLCATDLYGPLPIGRGGVRYILVILDVFSKYVKLYALKAATAKACVNKMVGHYVANVIKPKRILSDNGIQFASSLWRRKLTELGIEPIYVPVRFPEANPAERYMREIGKFCKIYCSQNHRKWPDLLSHIEGWLNGTVSDSTGYTPVELMEGKSRPDLFHKFLTKRAEEVPPNETTAEKAVKAFLRMKNKADRRNRRRKVGTTKWDPLVGDQVLVKRQVNSDGAAGQTSKFTPMFHGPFKIVKMTPPAMYEVESADGKTRGVFHKQAMKAYIQG